MISLTTNEQDQTTEQTVVIATTNGSYIHFYAYGQKYHDEGTQLIIHIITAVLPEGIITDLQGALAFADLKGIAPEDVKHVDEVLRNAETKIAKGYIGLLMIDGVDPWAFKVAGVEIR